MIKELDTRYGKMFVPENDTGQYWWLSNTGASPEDNFIEMMCDLLDERSKGCAVDVGANFGCWTLPLSKHAHTVVSLEPQICVYELLRESLDANKITNVDLKQMGAGDYPRLLKIPHLDINIDTNFGGIGLGDPVAEQPDAPMDTVAVQTLDVILQGHQVSFIKIDVEGYESRVVKGARKTIERCKPFIFAEMDHPKTDKEKLKDQIERFGYAVEVQGGNFLGVPL